MQIIDVPRYHSELLPPRKYNSSSLRSMLQRYEYVHGEEAPVDGRATLCLAITDNQIRDECLDDLLPIEIGEAECWVESELQREIDSVAFALETGRVELPAIPIWGQASFEEEE